MMHDLFIPCRIGDYYLHTKKVVTIEITPVVVYGLVLEYSAKKIILKEKYVIPLKENSPLAQKAAVKKIISSAGKVEEIISVSRTPAMIFKELELPFLGKENLKMVLPLEIENMLPFSLDLAVIDFIVTKEDLEKKTSTVLVCAIRKQDIDEQYEFFKNADISLDMLTVDVFALYRLYQKYNQKNITEKKPISSKNLFKEKLSQFTNSFSGIIFRKKNQINSSYSEQILQNFQPNKSEVLVDIGYESIKVLYIKDSILHSVRVIPFGIGQRFEALGGQVEQAYADAVHVLSTNSELDKGLSEQIRTIFDEVSKTLLYFQQQQSDQYLSPSQIIFTGFYSNFSSFINQAKLYFGSIISSIDMQECLKHVSIINQSKSVITSQDFNILSSALLWHYDTENNLLQSIAEQKQRRFATMQLIVMVVISILCIGTVWWRASEQLQRWQTAYNVSRKQLLTEIQSQMGLDLYGEKNLKTVVGKAEDVLKRERQLWFSFTQQNEASILEYLQDLSVAIDREAIGLELKTLHIDYQKIIMTGTVKNFEALDLFYEELQELKLLKLVDRPRELSWSIELKPKVAVKGAS